MTEAASEVRVGASGWSYADWVGPFYPAREEATQQRRLPGLAF